MKTDCMPFTAIPHNSRLFLDFLFQFDKVQGFYAHRPQQAAVLEYARNLDFPAGRRAQIAGVLERQNRAWDASTATLESIERFRQGAVACISGQQVSLLGGPLYSLLKAVSALQMAEQLTAQGCPAVPVFWLATEDHDLAEVAGIALPSRCELEKLTTTGQADSQAPVGRVGLPGTIGAVVERAAQLLREASVRGPQGRDPSPHHANSGRAGDPAWIIDALRESYREGESYGSAFARLFTRLLAGTGLILVNPLDDELHAIAQPLLMDAANRAAELDEALLERGRGLHRAGYHEQVRVTPDSTLLFSLEGNRRTVLHRADGGFLLGARRLTQQELLERIAAHPEQFSPNVLLRPVMQDFLFPTAVYFAGPAEIAYFAQAAVVYEKLLGRSTPIMHRLSATLIGPEIGKLLERYQLSFCDLFHGSAQVSELLAARVLAPELREALEHSRQALESNLQAVEAELHKLDPTLVEAASRSRRKMLYQLSKIGSKAARAELRRNPQLAQDACRVLTELFPNKELQERVLPGIYFLAQYGPELLSTLKQAAAHPCPGHQIVHL